jgi:hypothetical protein
MYPSKMAQSLGRKNYSTAGSLGGRNTGLSVAGLNIHRWEAGAYGRQGLVDGDLGGLPQQPYVSKPGEPTGSQYYTNNANQITWGRQSQSSQNNWAAMQRRDSFGQRRSH